MSALSRLHKRQEAIVLGFALFCLDRGEESIDAKRLQTVFPYLLKIMSDLRIEVDSFAFRQVEGEYPAITEILSGVTGDLLFKIPPRGEERYFFDHFFKNFAWNLLEEHLSPDEVGNFWEACTRLFSAYVNDTKFVLLKESLKETHETDPAA